MKLAFVLFRVVLLIVISFALGVLFDRRQRRKKPTEPTEVLRCYVCMGNVFVDPDDDELTLHRSADPGKLCPGGSQPAWMSREMKANDELEKARHLKVVP